MNPSYEPQQVEEKWYRHWEKERYFSPAEDKNKPVFVIMIPPPNVTGSLHMGHALNNTIQDILIRTKRMQGHSVLWLPGTDHAGIPTQMLVERDLAKQGIRREALGRDQLVQKIWEWKEKYGNIILDQLRRLGCSCDWTRTRFTMDEGYTRAVEEAFMRLYRKGRIYRGWRIINWCVKCKTAVSDLEVIHKETKAALYYVRYPLVENIQHSTFKIQNCITVATTRPETMLGDTGVAVHPDDDRYKHLVGKKALLPVLNREIPVVADSFVDPQFGTGAVKVTPAHDPNDFEAGLRCGLPAVIVIAEDGKMTHRAGKYNNMDRFECRKKLVEELKEQGFLEKEKDYTHSVGTHDRCATVIEPLLSLQWFVKMEELAKPAAQVVRDGKVQFIPERFANVYLSWLENPKDWCISRQIWWGHSIPVKYCKTCKEKSEKEFRLMETFSLNTEATVSGVYMKNENASACSDCGGKEFEPDPDVLDTWFSSALWPFAALGWPGETQDMKRFYPTTVLSTARDIIYLWVARMVMTGLEFLGDIPFSDVYVHATVLNPEGKRMSKSLGTGVDPLDLMKEYGTDATRFGIIWQTVFGQDLKFKEEHLKAAKHFCNKLWNATRFVLHQPNTQHSTLNTQDGFLSPDNPDLRWPEKWLLSELNRLIADVTEHISDYKFDSTARDLYQFVWGSFCDRYVEISKSEMAGERAETVKQVLLYTLSVVYHLLHPFMPYITEELWSKLPVQNKKDLMVSPWPEARKEWINPEAEAFAQRVFDVVRVLRNLRAEGHVKESEQVEVLYSPQKETVFQEGLNDAISVVQMLAKIKRFSAEHQSDVFKQCLSARVHDFEFFLPMAGRVDIPKELALLEKEMQKIEKTLAASENRLSDQNFLTRADPETVELEKEKYQGLAEKMKKIKERKNLLKTLRSV